MAQPKLKELKIGESFIGFYLVESKRARQTREGGFFIDLDLRDVSGTLNGKIWEDFERYQEEFERGDIVKLEGIVESYRDQAQVRVKRIRKARAEDRIDYSLIIPSTRQDVNQMVAEIREIISRVKNPYLQKLLELYWNDEGFMEKLKTGPAARNLHHSYLGGLLEHIWHMLKIAHLLAGEIYPALDYDLIITGAFLHDLGKIDELNSFPVPSYTRAGYLEGHIILGLKSFQEKVSLISDFPEELKLHLEHIILSHHGEKEWGSPVLPATSEAMLIHFIDNLDAKLAMIEEAIEQDWNQNEEFTGWHPILERHIYKRRVKDIKTEGDDEL